MCIYIYINHSCALLGIAGALHHQPAVYIMIQCLSQWCTTSGLRATSGLQRVLMWPATPNKKSDYFRANFYIKSTVDHKSSTLNQPTTIFNLTSSESRLAVFIKTK